MNNQTVNALETPALLLDAGRMNRNIARMREQLARFDVEFRPHVKTAKCAEVALAMSGGVPGPLHALIEIDCDGHRAGILPACSCFSIW